MFVFTVLHYPSPDHRVELACGMAEMRDALLAEPGCLGVEAPLTTEIGSFVIGYSRWESKEAFLADEDRAERPFDDSLLPAR